MIHSKTSNYIYMALFFCFSYICFVPQSIQFWGNRTIKYSKAKREMMEGREEEKEQFLNDDHQIFA